MRLYFAGQLNELKDVLKEYDSIFIVCDGNLADIAGSLRPCPVFMLRSDEESKSMESVMSICRWLMDNGAARDSIIVAIGGGVTSDVAGFAASIYMRGIRYGNVPTTLLAQVDASIGGKTAVNVDHFKNMVGTFHQSEFTFICPSLLETLPERELRSGLAELVKTFIISSESDYEEAVKVLATSLTQQALAPFIIKAARAKAAITGIDEKEHGERGKLNLGHTFGHAIEWYQHSCGDVHPLSHGQAVAAGIVKAAEISERLGIADYGVAKKITEDFRRLSLPVSMPCPEDVLAKALIRDKKSDGRTMVNMALIERIGSVKMKKVCVSDLLENI